MTEHRFFVVYCLGEKNKDEFKSKSPAQPNEG